MNKFKKSMSFLLLIAAPILMSLFYHSDPVVFKTAKSGDWNDPRSWVQLQVPTAESNVEINPKHIVTLKNDVTIGKLIIDPGGSLVFDRTRSVTLEETGNLILYGKLQMRPSSAAIVHTIRFIGIDETKFVGTTDSEMMTIPDSDVGLWIRNGGIWDAAGTSKTAWTRLKTFANVGDNYIVTSSATSGWKPGDEISITPTLPITDPNYIKGFDNRRVMSINRDTVFMDSAIKFSHPRVLNQWTKKYYTAEVMNLTRNVRVEGTPTGRSHINMHMLTGKFTHTNIAIRYMGPRQPDGKYSRHVLGRYGYHDHMNGDATRGSVITGLVVRDCGGWGIVLHGSHGITANNCITLETMDAGFTWDFPPKNGTDTMNNSNGITYNNCIAAIVRSDPPFRGYRMPGFQMNAGKDNVCTNCVVVGIPSINSNAFDWSEKDNYVNNNVWKVFKGNIAHNNGGNANMSWQNDTGNHVIEGCVAFRNGGFGFEDGAYHNAYKVLNCYFIENGGGVLSHSQSMPKGIKDTFGYLKSYSNVKSTEPFKITRHLLFDGEPVLLYNCNYSMIWIEEIVNNTSSFPGLYDFVNCNIKSTDFNLVTVAPGSLFRVQNITGPAYMINDKKEITTIPKFFPKK